MLLTVLSTLNTLTHLTLTCPMKEIYYCPHFAEKITLPRSLLKTSKLESVLRQVSLVPYSGSLHSIDRETEAQKGKRIAEGHKASQYKNS